MILHFYVVKKLRKVASKLFFKTSIQYKILEDTKFEQFEDVIMIT